MVGAAEDATIVAVMAITAFAGSNDVAAIEGT